MNRDVVVVGAVVVLGGLAATVPQPTRAGDIATSTTASRSNEGHRHKAARSPPTATAARVRATAYVRREHVT